MAAGTVDAQTSAPGADASWGKTLAEYARPDLRRSLLDLATSIVPFVGLTVLGYVLLGAFGPLAALALALPTAGFLLRTYIVFHDCTHGAFLPTKRANTLLGAVLGVVVWTPFAAWKHEHAVHHATAGDLDRRGSGDVPVLTVAEYRSRSRGARLAYRLFRNPLVMFGLGPIWAMLIGPRITRRGDRPRKRRSILATNAALLVVVGGTILLVGLPAYLLVQGVPIMLAGSAGVWLFYVQHQFEDVYWENNEAWSYNDAALRGSSYLRLPRVLQFFTGNIGLHHVHHLSARIPNYNLQRAHDEIPALQDVPTLSLLDGLRTSRLKLWDEERQGMVGFAEAER